MSPPQCEVIPKAPLSQPNQESQESTRLLHQTKKTLPILRYKNMTDESVKLVLSTFTGYERNHEGPPFSINYAKDFTASLIGVTFAIPDPKYHVSPINQKYGYDDS